MQYVAIMSSTSDQLDSSAHNTKNVVGKKSLVRLLAVVSCAVLSLWDLVLAVLEIASGSPSLGLILALPGIAWMLAAISWWRGGRTMQAWIFMIIAVLLWDSILM